MQSGEAKEAEAAFRQAIALEPSSVNAKLALANFLWAAGRAPEAEAAIKEALAKEPQHLLANRMLGRAVPRDPADQGSGAAAQGRRRHLEDACRPLSAG